MAPLDIAQVWICEENRSSQTSVLLGIAICVHYVMKHDLFVDLAHVGIYEES